MPGMYYPYHPSNYRETNEEGVYTIDDLLDVLLGREHRQYTTKSMIYKAIEVAKQNKKELVYYRGVSESCSCRPEISDDWGYEVNQNDCNDDECNCEEYDS